MSEVKPRVMQVEEIPPSIVRTVLQAPPSPADFRSKFQQMQPAVSSFLNSRLKGQRPGVVTFCERMTAAVWAIYDQAAGGVAPLQAEDLETREGACRDLLAAVAASHGEDELDAEWLVDLPREPQPHVMGFMIGALRASRVELTPQESWSTAALLLAVAGAFEAGASRKRDLARKQGAD